MIRLIALLLPAALVSAAIGQDAQNGAPAKMDNPKVVIETTLGDITIELDANRAPISVRNFLQYAADGYYADTVFHRVMSNFMIQGGGFTTEMDKKESGLRPMIKNEWRNGVKNKRGTIAMARLPRQPHSATAQFFISVVDNANLDSPADGAAYAVFGKVVEGMDVVDKIRTTKLIAHPKYRDRAGAVTPKTTVVIKAVRLVGSCDREALAKLCDASEKRIVAYDGGSMLEQEEQAGENISKAETESGNKVQTSKSGLRWVILKEGDGPTPAATDTVEVHYTGWLVSGRKFDSSVDRGRPFPFSLTGGVIQGWLEGVATMRVGEKRKLIIPPELGYKKRGSPPKIPGNSILVFDVELLAIK